jgi:uncharacterized protein with PQ loop repeat
MEFMRLIGNTTLNISFFLYLVVYIPQVLHNRHSSNIAQLSLVMHLLLYTSYCFDLIYGVASHFQWQYKTVSVVGLSLIMLQHLQLTNYFLIKKMPLLVATNVIVLTSTFVGIYYFFIPYEATLNTQTIAIIGSIARLCSLTYCLPQVVKNRMLKSTHAISIRFIVLNLMLAMLDTSSAWCLNWGWPNKLASPLTVLIMSAMLVQVRQYSYRTQQ